MSPSSCIFSDKIDCEDKVVACQGCPVLTESIQCFGWNEHDKYCCVNCSKDININRPHYYHNKEYGIVFCADCRRRI